LEVFDDIHSFLLYSLSISHSAQDQWRSMCNKAERQPHPAPQAQRLQWMWLVAHGPDAFEAERTKWMCSVAHASGAFEVSGPLVGLFQYPGLVLASFPFFYFSNF
jgi:hypothetical protein